MKKIIAAVAVVATVGLFGSQFALAQRGMGGGMGPGMGPGNCWQTGTPGANAQVMDETTLATRQAFLDATTDLRREMAGKRAEMRAIMNSASPDEARAGKLAEEMFDLRTQIQAKATETGWKGGFGGGGYWCNGYGPGGGKGMGGGHGYGRHHRGQGGPGNCWRF